MATVTNDQPTRQMEITLHNVSTGYGRRVVARGLQATLSAGTLTCLLGSNGAGKSTLLRTIGGFQPALGGEVLVDGHPVSSLSAGQMSRLMSVVLTERIDVPGLTVRDLVAMGRAPYTGFWGVLDADDHRMVQEAMQQVGIGALASRQVRSLSDGERQKAVIAKALAQHTPVILLDEPTAFLDFPSKVDTLRLLSRLAHQMHKAVLLSTHDVQLALQLGDCLWLLDSEGLSVGTPRALAADGTIARFFACQGVEFTPATLSFRITQ